MFIKPYRDVRYSQIVEFVYIIIFAVVIALRPSTTPDTAFYIRVFEKSNSLLPSIKSIDLFSKYYDVEYGYLVLCSLFRGIINDYHVFFFVIALVTVYFIPRNLTLLLCEQQIASKMSLRALHIHRRVDFVIKPKESFLRSCYIIAFGILYSGIAIRAGLAITFGTWAVYLTNKKNFLGTVIALFVGFSIHRTLIVFTIVSLLVLMFNYIGNTKVNRIFMVISLVELVIMSIDLRLEISSVFYNYFSLMLKEINLIGYYDSFIGSGNSSVGITKMIICLCIFTLLATLYFSRIYVSIFYQIMAIASMTTILLFVNARAVSRLYDLFLLFCIPILKAVFDDYSENKRIFSLISFISIISLLAIVSLKTCFINILL
jgi:hypothetical protein